MFQQHIDQMIEFVKTNSAWAPAIMFALAFAESLAVISLLVPAWGALVAIGALIGTGALPYWPILIAGAIGAALGDWVSYWLGAKYGHAIFQMWPLSKSPNLLPKGEAFFRKWGIASIFIGRFSGPLRASVPLVAGIFEMDFWKFQIANVLSAFLWAAVLLASGQASFELLKKFGG